MSGRRHDEARNDPQRVDPERLFGTLNAVKAGRSARELPLARAPLVVTCATQRSAVHDTLMRGVAVDVDVEA